MPRIVQAAVGAVVVVASFLLARAAWSLEAKMIAFAGVAALAVLVALFFQRRLLETGVAEPADPDEVMPGAREFVVDFEREGFRRVGGFRWSLRGRLVVETILAPAERDRYAVVTDRVLELVSRFGARELVTTNSGRAPAPEDALRRVIRNGRPSELMRARDDALDRLAERRLSPDRFLDDADILRTVREAEERALRNVRVPSLATLLVREARLGGGSDGRLSDYDESHRRIEARLRRGS